MSNARVYDLCTHQVSGEPILGVGVRLKTGVGGQERTEAEEGRDRKYSSEQGTEPGPLKMPVLMPAHTVFLRNAEKGRCSHEPCLVMLGE